MAVRLDRGRLDVRLPARSEDALQRDRFRRSVAAVALAVAGVADLASAVMPPFRRSLQLLLRVVPLVVPETAAAITGLVGLVLLALAWGVRKGQRQAWTVSVVLLASTVVLHLLKGVELIGSMLSVAVLVYLVIVRHSFRTAVDRPSRRFAALCLLIGTVVTTVSATAAVEAYFIVETDHEPLEPFRALRAVAERMVGVQTVVLPRRLNQFLAPSLATIGYSLAALSLFLAFRSVVARRRTQSPNAARRTRELVREHGAGTLDYFALRHDKQAFFHGQTVVTYGVYGGVCLVSPDPIGPNEERAGAWEAFRRFADGNGWVVAVLGAGSEWLETYRDAGMRSIYVGDEAVVELEGFSLEGGRHKGLRQAVNRIANHGYTVSFHDPADVDPLLASELRELLAVSRRGAVERGFSMTLGRMFHPEDEGLLLAVAHDPSGRAVALCQFVPSPSIGGYSLDVMRRDGGNHPNGLFDFLIVSTIRHLRTVGFTGLGLNFATMRAVLAGESGDNAFERLRRLVLRRLSRSMQIESLWRFNAKYDPRWQARYLTYGAIQQLPAVAVAIVRAESLWDLPVLGRLLVPAAVRKSRRAAA